MSNVTLQGFIIVPESDLSAVVAELPNHIERTLAEPGCISFQVIQDSNDPRRFNVTEEFQDSSSFRQHQARVAASHWGTITHNVERHYTISGLKE